MAPPILADVDGFDLRTFMGNRLLLVDDEEDALLVFRARFEDDYEVHTATSGRAGLDLLDAFAFDVIVADQRMPEMTGVEFLGECARRQPDATRIMLTAYADAGAMIQAINRCEVFRFITKPWDEVGLVEALHAGVEQHAYRKAIRHLIRELRGRNAELAASLADLQQAQSRLLHSERLATIGQLTSGVVHEIRNQLQGMQLLVEAVRDLDASPETLSCIDFGVQSLDAVYHMVDDLSRVARNDTSWRHRAAPTDLNDIVRQALRVARVHRKLKHARIIEDLQPLPLVEMDDGKMRQVFLNLLRNATDALPERDPWVRLETRVVGDTVMAAVVDNGTGIAPENVQRVFEPFFSTKPVGGLGMGLHICREIVAAHGGALAYEPAPGTGARFVVTLPLRSA